MTGSGEGGREGRGAKKRPPPGLTSNWNEFWIFICEQTSHFEVILIWAFIRIEIDEYTALHCTINIDVSALNKN